MRKTFAQHQALNFLQPSFKYKGLYSYLLRSITVQENVNNLLQALSLSSGEGKVPRNSSFSFLECIVMHRIPFSV